MVGDGQRMQFVQARNNAVIFDICQPADMQDELWLSSPGSELIADPFDVPIGKPKSLSDLPKPKARKHKLLY